MTFRYSPLPAEMLQYARSDTHFLLYVYDNLRNALLDRATSRAQSRAQSPSSSNTIHSSLSGNAAYELIKQVLTRSEETALRIYEKEFYDTEGGSGSNGWDVLARKWNKGALMAGGPDVGIGGLQRLVYKAVHKWRDAVAREDDESVRYARMHRKSISYTYSADMSSLIISCSNWLNNHPRIWLLFSKYSPPSRQ